MSQDITAGELGPQHLGKPVYLAEMGDRDPVPLAEVRHWLSFAHLLTQSHPVADLIPDSHSVGIMLANGARVTVSPRHPITIHEKEGKP